MELQNYFSPNYAIARERFCQTARSAGAELAELPIEARGPEGEALTIDLAWLGSRSPRRLLLHTSGVHGVEGFVGSAIQQALLAQPPQPAEDEALAVVHAINPYGMAWLRRVNENNVDLNRNFLAEDDRFEGVAEAYRSLNSFLNPESPPGAADFFLPKAAASIVRYGFKNLKQAIAQGQYEFPRGLFFGGGQREPSAVAVMDWLASRLENVAQVFAIDVHSGLGRYGDDVLLVSEETAAEQVAALTNRFGERVSKLDPGREGYRVRGDFLRALRAEFFAQQWICVCQEFGTYHPLKVLYALREENRWHQYGTQHDLEHHAKQRLLKAFCPNDEHWRRRILHRGRELFESARKELLARQRGA